jgi:hypothetical protein
MPTPLNLPVAYRLAENGDGNGNDVPTLQGLFLEYNHNNNKIEGSWRELETQPQWGVPDGSPFAPS